MSKKIERKLENINANLINGVICGIGVILVLIGITIGVEKIFSQVCLSIGTSLMASSIVVFVSSKYLVKQNKIKDMIQQWKLSGIFETRAEMNKSTDFNLKNNKESLDIVAFGLKSFRDSKKGLIEQKIKQGMNIRILTINPESQFLKERERVEKEVDGQIKNTIIQLSSWVRDLQQDEIHEHQVQIKYYDSLPLDFYFGLDNAIYIGPYLYGIQSQQTISFEFKKGGQGFNHYKDYFEQLWNDKNFCRES